MAYLHIESLLCHRIEKTSISIKSGSGFIVNPITYKAIMVPIKEAAWMPYPKIPEDIARLNGISYLKSSPHSAITL